jgi:protein phosphatase-4 regulatory subunit 3
LIYSTTPGVIRFFRRLIGSSKAEKDKLLVELIMNEDLFSPIISVLKNNNGRYNLLDSAILELFEYIQAEGILPLMNHVLTNFGPFLESIDYVSTFKVMRQKKEALHDEMSNNSLKLNLMDDEDFDIELEPQFKRQRME